MLVLDAEDPRLAVVKRLLGTEGLIEIIETDFSKDELRAAPFVSILSSSFSGYPEPRNDFQGVLAESFDLSDYCPECGLGKLQNGPLILRSEPNWGKRMTFQLHWFFDVVFVRPEVYHSVFEAFGIGAWPVNNLRGNPLEVVQLRFDSTVSLRLPNEHPALICKRCRRPKFEPWPSGFWPLPEPTASQAFLSHQEFGYGGEARREIYISHELYMRVSEVNLNLRYWATAARH